MVGVSLRLAPLVFDSKPNQCENDRVQYTAPLQTLLFGSSMKFWLWIGRVVAIIGFVGCTIACAPNTPAPIATITPAAPIRVVVPTIPARTPTPRIVNVAALSSGERIALAAEQQVGVTTIYDPQYVKLDYPNGDVPAERGVCTDVVVRAFRAIGVDLQVRVHEDMQKNFDAYPKDWGLKAPDSSIDHRRVQNLTTYFQRMGKQIKGSDADVDFKPGDIVAWRLGSWMQHIGVVAADKVEGTNRYYMVHNIGAGTQKEDVLRAYTIIGHYRW